MPKPLLVLCNGYPQSEVIGDGADWETVSLSSRGTNPNVTINFEHVAKVAGNSSLRLIDLVEIAAFVYAMDCATARGSSLTRVSGNGLESWDREFHIAMPVYDPEFWSSSDINAQLQNLLGFLSDDNYVFEFKKSTLAPPIDEYLEFDSDAWPFEGSERVLMFSGGLDSLAGAIEAIDRGDDVVLVSHRSAAQVNKRTHLLFEQLQKRSTKRMIRVPVVVQRKGRQQEFNPRTRSFLFATLGLIVAESLKASGIRFYENGIVSLNLPVADEVLRSRASRTTHPISLRQLESLFSKVIGRDIVIDNPFLVNSKKEILAKLQNAKAEYLIPYSCSCAHVLYMSKSQQHCGTCSQCIDRRMAILAAGCEDYDPETDYVNDVFTGPRKDGYQKSMAVDYVRHAMELRNIGDVAISEKFGVDLLRASRGFSDRAAAVQSFISMHTRHGEAVYSVVESQLRANSDRVLDGNLPESSLLGMVIGKKHLEASWRNLAIRIGDILGEGIPLACQTKRPQNELRLQELCVAVLAGFDLGLSREFPFMKWSLSSTKPDFSADSLALWIEIKYVREKAHVKSIIASIAEDITKYGDNGRRVLFWVYDPDHHIIDEKAFSNDIENHGMLVRFAR